MRVWELDDEARETIIQTGDTSMLQGSPAITIENCANAPAGKTWQSVLECSPPNEGSNAYMECRQLTTSELTLDFWVYLNAYQMATDYARLVIFQAMYMGHQAHQRFEVGFRMQTDIKTCRPYMIATKDDGTTSVESALYPTTNGQEGGTAYQFDSMAAPSWHHFVVTWKAESAVGAGDGAYSLTHYTGDTATRDAWLVRTGKSTGILPIDRMRMVVYTQGQNYGDDAPVFQVGDVRILDSAGDVPGVLMPWLHSAGETTCKLKLICDRPCSGVVTYGATGTESTATDISSALVDDDDGRILEFSLTGLTRGSTYVYKVALTGDDATTATITTIDGVTCSFRHNPLPTQRVHVAAISDVHEYLNTPRMEAQLDAILGSSRGVAPDCVIYGGDCYSMAGGGTYADYERGAIRRMHGVCFDRLRRLAAGTQAIWVTGNHDLYDTNTTTSVDYLQAIVPPATVPGYRRQQWGPAEFFIADDHGFTAKQMCATVIPWIESALATSDATHKIVCIHGWGVDAIAPEEAQDPGNTTGMKDSGGDTPAADLHAVLAARAALGERVSLIHGHTHGGAWWVKDNVVYMCMPTGSTYKDTGSGDYELVAGEGDTRLNSLSNFGVDGSGGWLKLIADPNWFRCRIYGHSYVNATDVYTYGKQFEQWRMVR